MLKKIIFISLFFISSICLSQQPTPAAAQKVKICLRGAIVHIGNGNAIKNAQVVFESGKIIYVGTEQNLDANTRIVNCSGKHIYPGFIAPNTTLGLTEIEAVRATNDYYEVGSNNASTRALVAYYTDSKVVPTVRNNGVLIAQITPRGGLFSGQSSLVSLDAWNWQDAVIKADDGIHLNWPKINTIIYTDEHEISVKEKNKNYESSMQLISKYFLDAKVYSKSDKKESNLLLEAANGLFNGTKNLYIHVNETREIIDAINLAKSNGVTNIVLIGGTSAHLIANFIKQNNVSVMIERPHSLPKHTDDDIDMPYKTAKLLYDADILFCIQNEGDMEAMNCRNLPFLAGTCVANGLPYEQAVAAISFNAAKILGIDAQCGSIEVGKDATLFVSDGDALDMKTNNISNAFIQGREIELTSVQTQLYNKFKTKYDIK